jgi:hypothetical protein
LRKFWAKVWHFFGFETLKIFKLSKKIFNALLLLWLSYCLSRSNPVWKRGQKTGKKVLFGAKKRLNFKKF